MAKWHGVMGKGNVGGWGSMRENEDLEEEDVWSVMKEMSEDSSPKMMMRKSSPSSTWCRPTAPRMIPRTNIRNPPPPTITNTTHEVQQSSAPVNIPDWSKIYGKSARMGSWADDDDAVVVHDGDGDDDNDDDDDDEMVPPHEWIARKLARSQISSFSMCEGIGRTLKGRDLSKVRNAVLTKTGFLE